MNRSSRQYLCRCVAQCIADGLLLTAAVMLAGCQPTGTSQAGPPEGPSDPLPRVRAAQARLESWPRLVRVQGNLQADEIAIVGAKVANRVKEVSVDLGSIVRRGDALVTLDTEELDFRVQQAEAQLEQARARLGLKPDDQEGSLDRLKVPSVVQAETVWNESKLEYERAKSLLPGKAIPAEEVQQRQAAMLVAEAKYRGALNDVNEQIALVAVKRAELGLARQFRADAVIRAPFDGVVQNRHVAPGSYLQVGQAVVTLVRTDPLRFRGGVPEREAPCIQLRQTARITVEGQANVLSGQVTRVSPALEMSSRALCVEIDLPNPDARLQVGLFAEADVVVDPTAQTLAVPATAVREFAGVERVWLVRDGSASQQLVQTGRRGADRVEILQGLSAGDVVLTDAREGSAGPLIAEVQDRLAPGPSPQK
jgi:RND family efflux transporter MFP subunit